MIQGIGELLKKTPSRDLNPEPPPQYPKILEGDGAQSIELGGVIVLALF